MLLCAWLKMSADFVNFCPAGVSVSVRVDSVRELRASWKLKQPVGQISNSLDNHQCVNECNYDSSFKRGVSDVARSKTDLASGNSIPFSFIGAVLSALRFCFFSPLGASFAVKIIWFIM